MEVEVRVEDEKLLEVGELWEVPVPPCHRHCGLSPPLISGSYSLYQTGLMDHIFKNKTPLNGFNKKKGKLCIHISPP